MNLTNPVKAIRAKCLDCCCDNAKEVELCHITGCALHPFRFGKNPYRTKQNLSEEELQRRRLNMSNVRAAKHNKIT